MEQMPILHTIGAILFYFAKLLLIIAGIVAFYKYRNSGSVILLIGSIAIVLADIIGLLLIINAGKEGILEVAKYTGINSIISAVTYIVFASGLLLFIIQLKKQPIRKEF